jgi:cytoskeletal protein RodZ
MSPPVAPAPARGESFGRYLAQQRELRGLTLENVGDATKLSLSTLRALEADDAAHLPERVFLVGAVRAYARAVGLSPEETVLRLHEALGSSANAEVQLPRRRRSAGRAIGILIGLAAAGAVAALLLRH